MRQLVDSAGDQYVRCANTARDRKWFQHTPG
jgi:hypothetical protein